MALPVLSKVLEVMLEPEDAPPLFLELFKGFEFTDAELQALNAVCKPQPSYCTLGLLLTSRLAVVLDLYAAPPHRHQQMHAPEPSFS